MEARQDEDAKALLIEYGLAAAAAALVTFVCRVLDPRLGPTNLAMVYLLGAAVVRRARRASRARRACTPCWRCAVASTSSSCLQRMSFAVTDASEYLVTFAVMLTVSLMISTMVPRCPPARRGRGPRGAPSSAPRPCAT